MDVDLHFVAGGRACHGAIAPLLLARFVHRMPEISHQTQQRFDWNAFMFRTVPDGRLSSAQGRRAWAAGLFRLHEEGGWGIDPLRMPEHRMPIGRAGSRHADGLPPIRRDDAGHAR
ncbi:hypothetical protein FH063_000773 [Azospirillum argentinense]|uniref:Uncharacterized protein n=1 Tax=Azospirillum argentinense TaxID=2970906 RepID=A0A5B0L3Z0_9PROT|nr:hypothetical protein FH063_000773 [Azospirillum argentinense]